jgi:hypothetical protein
VSEQYPGAPAYPPGYPDQPPYPGYPPGYPAYPPHSAPPRTRAQKWDYGISFTLYDQATQQRLDAYNQKVQETKNAQQDVQTAEQSRLAAEARARQTPPDLRIAISNCLNDMVKSGRDPAGCWGQPGGQPLIQIPRPTP